MSVPEPTDAVLWLSDVVISRPELEIELSAAVEAFGPQKSGVLSCAKYVFEGDVWRSVLAFFELHGSAVQRLIACGSVGAATLDIAYMSDGERITRSARIPAGVASKIGSSGVDLIVSTYPIDPD